MAGLPRSMTAEVRSRRLAVSRYIGTVATIKTICWLSAAVVLALSMAACGASVSVDEKGVSVDSKTYDVAALPFTFKYPVDFREGTDASIRGFRFGRGLVGLPGTESYMLVLSNDSRREKTIAELQREAVASGAQATMHETHSGMPMLKAVLPDTDPKGRRGVQYAFAAGGATWLIQCVAEDAQRETIDAACKRAIDSLQLRP